MNLDLAPEHPRCVRGWQPGVWVGAVRRAIGPLAELVEAQASSDDTDINAAQHDEDTLTFEQRPAQWLIALWKPQSLQRPFLARWPVLVQLTEAPGGDAVAELLQHLPHEARLWMGDHEVDWALMAEIVMLTESALAPWQHRELAQFILRERQATAQAIRAHYVGHDQSEPAPLERASPC